MKNYNIEIVERDLSKKGVIISHSIPVTQKATRYKDISEKKVKERIAELGLKPEIFFKLQLEGKLLTTLGITPERITVTEEVQPAFCVNIGNANNLGNKSWGKIDFLINHKGYRLIRARLNETKAIPEPLIVREGIPAVAVS